MLKQLQHCESKGVSENMGISQDPRGCQHGATDIADHKSGSADRITDITSGRFTQFVNCQHLEMGYCGSFWNAPSCNCDVMGVAELISMATGKFASDKFNFD